MRSKMLSAQMLHFLNDGRMRLLCCCTTVPIPLPLLRVCFAPQSNIRGAKKHEVIQIKARQRNVYLQNEAGQGKKSRAGEK